MGLAAASVAAAGATTASATAPATIAENEELLRLGNELSVASAAFYAARQKRSAVIAEWSPQWPIAPEALIVRGGGAFTDSERSLIGRGIVRDGNEWPHKVTTTEGLAWEIDRCKRVLKGKTVDRQKVRGLTRKDWEERLAEDLADYAIAEKYEAGCQRIRDASGYQAIDAAFNDAAKALVSIVGAIMAQPEQTMAGVVVKAQALALTGDAHIFFECFADCGKWASEFSASVLKIAGEQA
ncbi:hypothetical protein ACEQ6A_11390 [Rhizobium brockwellii]|uniref:hypothetical protein n=1 Tax=Rhizobium brockwellii TaxID=3019932 RepID=UPI003F95716A